MNKNPVSPEDKWYVIKKLRKRGVGHSKVSYIKSEKNPSIEIEFTLQTIGQIYEFMKKGKSLCPDSNNKEITEAISRELDMWLETKMNESKWSSKWHAQGESKAYIRIIMIFLTISAIKKFFDN